MKRRKRRPDKARGHPLCGSEAPANVLYGTLRRLTEGNTGAAQRTPNDFVAAVENLCIIRARTLRLEREHDRTDNVHGTGLISQPSSGPAPRGGDVRGSTLVGSRSTRLGERYFLHRNGRHSVGDFCGATGEGGRDQYGAQARTTGSNLGE